MARIESTESLVDRFLQEPGLENELLEIKAKEKVKSPNGRRQIVKTLVGMANQWGGTVIIGVKEEGNDRIQSFEPETEAKRDLSHIIRANTIPDLSKKVEINFVKISSGKHLLRIDVNQTDYEKYQFKEKGRDGPVPYYRVKDSTIEMGVEEAIEFEENRRNYLLYSSPEQTEEISIPTANDSPRAKYSSPDGRLVTSSVQHFQPIFGVELPNFEGRITLDLSISINTRTVDDLEELLEAARSHFSISRDYGFGYSINQGNRLHCGKGVERLLEDIKNIQEVISNMLGGHPREVDDDITHLDDYRATVVFGADCYYDFFHTQLYWKHGRFVKSRIGLILSDIPFDDKHLHNFFDDIGKSPNRYLQRSGIQKYVLIGDVNLQNSNPLQFEMNDNYIDFIEADNPFYGKQADVQHSLDKPLPGPLVERLCSIERIPLRIVDGTTDPGGREFRMKKLSILPVDNPWDNLFVQAECELRR